MAARRLLIVLLVLFGFSTLAAALIPVPPPAERSTRMEDETAMGSDPRLIERTIDAAARRPSRIRLREGDFLGLTIRAERVAQVEIPRLGVLEDVGPYAPATLELSPPEPGRYAIRVSGARRAIARLDVVPAG